MRYSILQRQVALRAEFLNKRDLRAQSLINQVADAIVLVDAAGM